MSASSPLLLGADGIALDAHGNVYCAVNGQNMLVVVRVDGSIDVWRPLPTASTSRAPWHSGPGQGPPDTVRRQLRGRLACADAGCAQVDGGGAWAAASIAGSRALASNRLGRTKVARLCKTRRFAPTAEDRKAAGYAETRMDRPPPYVHGKEGVDGSSPSEGFTKGQQMALFLALSAYVHHSIVPNCPQEVSPASQEHWSFGLSKGVLLRRARPL